MIPNIIHYIYGLNNEQEYFPLMYYISIISSIKFLNPEQIFFWYSNEPIGKWWDLTKQIVIPVPIPFPDYAYDNDGYRKYINNYKSRCDLIKLEALLKYGGIYLDLDTLIIKPINVYFASLLAIKQNDSLLSYFIATEPNHTFIQDWQKDYVITYKPRTSDVARFNLPAKLIDSYPECILNNEEFMIYPPEQIFTSTNLDVPSNLYILHLHNKTNINIINNYDDIRDILYDDTLYSTLIKEIFSPDELQKLSIISNVTNYYPVIDKAKLYDLSSNLIDNRHIMLFYNYKNNTVDLFTKNKLLINNTNNINNNDNIVLSNVYKLAINDVSMNIDITSDLYVQSIPIETFGALRCPSVIPNTFYYVTSIGYLLCYDIFPKISGNYYDITKLQELVEYIKDIPDDKSIIIKNDIYGIYSLYICKMTEKIIYVDNEHLDDIFYDNIKNNDLSDRIKIINMNEKVRLNIGLFYYVELFNNILELDNDNKIDCYNISKWDNTPNKYSDIVIYAKVNYNDIISPEMFNKFNNMIESIQKQKTKAKTIYINIYKDNKDDNKYVNKDIELKKLSDKYSDITFFSQINDLQNFKHEIREDDHIIFIDAFTEYLDDLTITHYTAKSIYGCNVTNPVLLDKNDNGFNRRVLYYEGFHYLLNTKYSFGISFDSLLDYYKNNQFYTESGLSDFIYNNKLYVVESNIPTINNNNKESAQIKRIKLDTVLNSDMFIYKIRNNIDKRHIFNVKDLKIISSNDYVHFVHHYLNNKKMMITVSKFEKITKCELIFTYQGKTYKKYIENLDKLSDKFSFIYKLDNDIEPLMIKGDILPLIQTSSSNIMSSRRYYSIYTNLNYMPYRRYIFYNDEACENFLQSKFDENIMKAYNTIIPGAYKADLFRHCYLYLNPAMYVDCKSILFQPFSIDYNDMEDIYCKDYIINCINNSFIIIKKKKSQVLKETIIKTLENIKNKELCDHQLFITGPGVLKYGLDKVNTNYDYKFFMRWLELQTKNKGTFILDSNNNVIFLCTYNGYYLENNYGKTTWYEILWRRGKKFIYRDDIGEINIINKLEL